MSGPQSAHMQNLSQGCRLSADRIVAVGAHGQTIRHVPPQADASCSSAGAGASMPHAFNLQCFIMSFSVTSAALTAPSVVPQRSQFRASMAPSSRNDAASTSFAISGAGCDRRCFLLRANAWLHTRSRDIAAGGQGAPLVPAFHLAQFAAPHGRFSLQHSARWGVTRRRRLTLRRRPRSAKCWWHC